jgi:hypothetical protein
MKQIKNSASRQQWDSTPKTRADISQNVSFDDIFRPEINKSGAIDSSQQPTES